MKIPVIIAGGLGPDNVVDAIRAVRPAGVDSKTRTDKDDGSHTRGFAKSPANLLREQSRAHNETIPELVLLLRGCAPRQ